MKNFWKDKKVLITGANGFLGSHLSLRLIEKGARVWGLIKEPIPDSYLNRNLRHPQRRKCRIIKCDIAEMGLVMSIFRRVRPVICLHVAAQPIVGLANKSPLPTFKANIQGTWNILEAARLSGIRSAVIASSDKAYGEHKKLPYKENASLRALHPYDASKACTDILAQVYAHTWGVPVAITRCANIYGPGDLNFSRIIPDTMRSVILDRNPVIRSDGSPIRDYIYIDDVVDAYLLLASRLYQGKVKKGEAFNFGNGKPINVLKLVRKILRLSGKDNLSPEIKSRVKIKGEIDRQYLSSAKARRILGWKPLYNFDGGLVKTLDWYRSFIDGKGAGLRL